MVPNHSVVKTVGVCITIPIFRGAAWGLLFRLGTVHTLRVGKINAGVMRSGLLLQGHAAPTSLVLSHVESINVAVVVWYLSGVQRGLCSSHT